MYPPGNVERLRGEARVAYEKNGDIPVFNDPNLVDRSGMNAHVAAFSFQEYIAEHTAGNNPSGGWKAGTVGLFQFASTFKFPQSEMAAKWTETQENWEHSQENESLERLKVPHVLEETMTWKHPPSKFLLFGLPSLELQRFSHNSYRQHYFTYRLVMHMLSRLYTNYRFVQTYTKPEIIIDSTHMTGRDRAFVKEMYGTGGDGWSVRFSMAIYMRNAPDKRGCMAIMYLPQNPTRQMIAEHAVLYNTLFPVLLCTRGDFDNDNLDMDGTFFSGDRTAEIVVDMLENYNYFGCHDGSELIEDNDGNSVEVFGITGLYILPDTHPNTPALGNTPMPSETNSPVPVRGPSPSALAPPEDAPEAYERNSPETQASFRRAPDPIGPLDIPDAQAASF